MSTFSVEGKGLKFNTAADIESFLSELKDDVTEIRLSGNTFGVEASVALAKVLRNKQQLQNAQMADIFTGRLREEIPAALEALLPALQSCPNLHTVNLCDNAFGPTAAAPLESFLASHVPLRHLYLQNNGMGPEAGARMARALAKNAEARLETVVCGRNRLENGSASAWVSCFVAHATSLQVVRMPQNGIRPEGIAQLMREGLGRCPSLRVVDLQDNTFTAKGSAALAAALPSWPELTELAVGDCLLGARGAANVFDALRHGQNGKLAVLRLQYNEIDAKALTDLKRAVELGLPALEVLELNGNRFEEEDASVSGIREIFEVRGKGELDELDDLEEDSDGEEDADDDDEREVNDENEAKVASTPDKEEDSSAERPPSQQQAQSSLDAAIEKNLAAALNSVSLTSDGTT